MSEGFGDGTFGSGAFGDPTPPSSLRATTTSSLAETFTATRAAAEVSSAARLSNAPVTTTATTLID